MMGIVVILLVVAVAVVDLPTLCRRQGRCVEQENGMSRLVSEPESTNGKIIHLAVFFLTVRFGFVNHQGNIPPRLPCWRM